MARRRAFSIIELLVVIVVVGILVALIAPAVQSARAAARRVQCLSHLRQIGIALHNYHEQFKKLPPFSVWAGPQGEPLGGGRWPVGVIDRVAMGLAPGSEPSRLHANWLLMLLPSLDQDAALASYNFDLPVSAPENAGVRMLDLPIFKCPSDPFNTSSNRYQRDYLAGSSDNFYARGNYGMNIGPDNGCIVELQPTCDDGMHVDDSDLQNKNHVLWGSGVGGVNKSFAFKDMTSGLSNVVAVDEIRAGVHAVDPRGSWALGFPGASGTMRHGLLNFPKNDAGGPNNSLQDSDDIVGCTELKRQLGQEQLAKLGMPCLAVTNETNNQATARSLHPGGVHVLMADGSADFVSDSINMDVWYNMHKRDSKIPIE